jgi:NAD-reducing hydrogenase small subunit
MAKKKLATVWLGGCSGCHMSLLDIDERILEVAKLADILKSPVVDGKEFPNATWFSWKVASATDEHVHEIQVIRKKAKVLVAFGDCAVTANVPAMRMKFTKEECLNRAYGEVETSVGTHIPRDPDVPQLIDHVAPLHEHVKVDYYIPGCPPSADLIFHVVSELLQDRVPVLDWEKEVKYG